MTRRQAAQAGGLVWEHYDAHWSIDWDYHRDDPKHLFRPWGFQPGHQTEWAKLLLILEPLLLERGREELAGADREAAVRHRTGARLGRRSRRHLLRLRAGRQRLRRRQVLLGAGRIARRRRAAARAHRPGRVCDWYAKLWAYAWQHFVDHRYGAWYRILTRDNRKYSDEKSPAGKTDYHTMGACYEVLALLRAGGTP